MSRVYVVALNERDQEISFLARQGQDRTAIKGGVLQLGDADVFAKFRLGLDFYLEAAVDEDPAHA